MDTNTPTAELEAEQAAQAEVKVEEIRASIVTEYGFDEVNDVERIDKLVTKEVENRKKLSSAIGQKIKHRTEANELRSKAATPPKQVDPAEIESLLDRKLNERLEKRDVESLEYSDELKTDIQKVAKSLGVSVKQAQAEPFIKFKIQEWEKANKVSEAAISRTNRSGTQTAAVPKADMGTQEGRDAWDKFTKENPDALLN